MDKTKDSGTWLKFFKEAGIPTKTGASYAHIFVENRITKDMLSDLTVDHLRLMGITLIGDVIAILRHAKSVHQDSLRKVVILKSKDDESSSSSSSSSSDSSDSGSSDSSSDSDHPDDRHGSKLIWSEPNSVKSLSSSVKKIKWPASAKLDESKTKLKSKVNDTSLPRTSKSSTGVERKTMAQHLKRKLPESEQDMEVDEVEYSVQKRLAKETNTSSGSGRSVLHRTQDTGLDIPPVKTKSAENQFMGPKLPPPKKTVFDRLGAETGIPQVSSTTEAAKPTVETKFTRTITNMNMNMDTEDVKIVANIDIPPPKASSVFRRLGESAPEPAPRAALPYAGVLKSPPTVTRTLNNITKKIVTMRADEPVLPIKLRAKSQTPLTRNIKLRVGQTSFKANQRPKLIRSNLTNDRFVNLDSEGIFANPKNELHLSAKDRVGLQKSKKVSTNNAKSRLGQQNNSGRTINTSQIKQRLNRPVQVKRQFGEDRFLGTSRNKDADKRVSFGGVVQRYISPMPAVKGVRNAKSAGVHSRLG